MTLAMRDPVREMAILSTGESELAAVNRKLDQLTAQVAFLAEEAENARRQRMMWTDLQDDLSPIVRDLYDVAEEELTSLRPHVELDDLLHFVRRLARNVRTFNEMLDQLESAKDFLADAAPITRELIDEVTVQMDQMERKGYFGFVRQGMYVADP
jgi:chromosome segregation ATPase